MADTQAMPALVKALTGVLPNTAIRQLMQALGNCNQPQTARGVQNYQYPEQLGNSNGVYQGGRWNPANYPGLLPSAGSPGQYEVPGPGGWQGGNFYGGSTNVNNYDGNSFYFPTSQEFNLNNFYGGPTLNVGGDSNFNNITVQNLNAQYINNVYAGGGVGFAQQPQEDPPLPGGALPSPGTTAPLPGFPGVLLPFPLPQGTREQPLDISGWVEVPDSATLGEDCKITFTKKRAMIFANITPRSIRVPA